jgi:hypothetical protein
LFSTDNCIDSQFGAYSLFMKRLALVFGTCALLLTGCAGASSHNNPAGSQPIRSTWPSEVPTALPSISTPTTKKDILSRLNSAGNLRWLEDPSIDTSGSNSIATYVEGTTNGCAVWVFNDAATAKAALVDGTLKFPGAQIYNGPDASTGLGIIVVSPYAGADCEFVVAKVFGWGK